MKITKGRWDGWSIDTDTRVLVYQDIYPIDLDRLCSGGGVLDYTFQVAQKSWATPDVVGGFILAVGELWGGLPAAQVSLAPSGNALTHHRDVLDTLLSALTEKWLQGM